MSDVLRGCYEETPPVEFTLKRVDAAPSNTREDQKTRVYNRKRITEESTINGSVDCQRTELGLGLELVQQESGVVIYWPSSHRVNAYCSVNKSYHTNAFVAVRSYQFIASLSAKLSI